MDEETRIRSDVGFVEFDGNALNHSSTLSENGYHDMELSKYGDKNDEYDPDEHRQIEHPLTNTDTMIHLLKGSLGTGILAMPNAFNNSGYVIGIIGTVIIACICTYAIHLLLQAEYELCKRKKVSDLSYPLLGEAAIVEGFGLKWGKIFAPYFGYMITSFLFIGQIGSCCIYIIFITSNIKSIADTYTEVETDIRIIMCIILIPMILLNWVRNLKYLAPFSIFANLITFSSFGIICYYIFRDPISFKDRKPIGEWKDIPLYFGTVLFALEAIGVMLPLKSEMQNPKSFGATNGVLNQAMAIISFLYIGLGLFGYLHYGEKIQGSITLNLPAQDLLAESVKGLLAFAICSSYTIQFYVAIDIFWTNWLAKRLTASKNILLWEYAVRTIIVLITFAFAAIIPNLELYISLFGALCLTTLGLAFPAIIQLLTCWSQLKGKKKLRVIAINSVLILTGVSGFIIGTYTSLSEIIKTFLE